MSKLVICSIVVAMLSVTSSVATSESLVLPPPAFEGRWRGVGAEIAPWTQSKTRLDTSSAELRGGIVIAADSFVGLAPFGCTSPRYTMLNVPPEGLFQGRLAGRDAADDADRMGFPDGEIRTLRIDCPNATFDFHLAGETTLKIAIDNLIRTFERPPNLPIDDNTFVAWPEPSFDCARARTTVQRVICSDEVAMHGDVRHKEQTVRYIGELSRTGKKVFGVAQRVYFERVHRECAVTGKMPGGNLLKPAAQCLAGALITRANFLDDMGVVGTRNRLTTEPRITMRVRVVPDSSGAHVEHDATPFAVEGPMVARIAFNNHVSEVLRIGQPLHGTPLAVGSVERKYTPSLITAGLVSFKVVQQFSGGTATAPRTRAINWNDTASRPLRLDDLFVPGSDWRAAFRAVGERHWANQATRTLFLAEVEDATRWSFEADRVVIWSAFDGPGQTLTDCVHCGVEIRASALRPFLRPDSPWLPQ